MDKFTAANQKIVLVDEVLASIDEVVALISAFTTDETKQALVQSVIDNIDDIKAVMATSANIDTIATDLIKGNYLGNRKIDIDLSLNKSAIDATVSYSKATIVLTDGTQLSIPFLSGEAVLELTSHNDIRNYIISHALWANVQYTECTVEEATSTTNTLIRFRDADGHSSNVERVELTVYSGTALDAKPSYFWANSTSALQTIANRVGDIIALGNDIDKIVALSQNIDELSELQNAIAPLLALHANLTELLKSSTYAQTASEKAGEASQSAISASNSAQIASDKAQIASDKATIATQKANEIKAITVQSTTGAAGSQVQVSYNPADGKFSFVIPQGLKGDRGEAFKVSAQGLLSERANYNTQPKDFSFFATDTSMVYFKNSDTSGDWSNGVSFGKGDKGDKGDTGNGISSLSFVSSNLGVVAGIAGATDTYRITMTSGNTHDFIVYNGANTDVNKEYVDNALALKANSEDVSALLQSIDDKKADLNDVNQALSEKVDSTALTQALASISSGGVRQTVSYAATDQVTGLPNFISVELTDTSSIHDVQGDGSIVATYPLDGNANDLGGNYNTTASGITYGTGKFGQCAVFNGSAYIAKTVTYKTFSLWFKISTMPASTAVICDNRDDNGDNFYGLQIDAGKLSSSSAYLYVNGVLTASGTYAPPLNTWIHVACVSTADSTNMVLGKRYTFDVNSFTGEIDQVRLFNRALTAAEVVMYSTETKPVVGLNVKVSATTKNIKFNCAGGDVDKEGKIKTDTVITGLSANTINYLYADIDVTSGVVTLGSTTIAPEYRQGILSTDFPTLDTVNKGSGVTLSNGNLTATKTVVNNWVNSNVYASKLVKHGKFYAEVTVGSVANTDFLHIGVSTINIEQSQQFSYNVAGYSYLNNGNKFNSASSVAYGASYTTGDKIGVLYDSITGQLSFYKNGVSQGVAYTLTANTPVYLAVSQYSIGNVTVNYGASAFAYPLPSGAVAWNTERVVGRHIFDTSSMEMWLSNGTAYDKKLRVFLGEATTNSTSVTSVINYALNGKYQSPFSSVSFGGTTGYSHNLGCQFSKLKLKLKCIDTDLGYGIDEIVDPEGVSSASTCGYGLSSTKNTSTLVIHSNGMQLMNKSTYGNATITASKWQKYIEIERGF